MVRLRKKMQSERGASILLALLMLLVCMMVAASVLGAAASNAGKARSNRVEQQKYLTVSSAIQLVADEIQQAEYTWKYTVYEWEDTTTTTDDDGNTTSITEYFFRCVQNEGEYECKDLTDLLPLQKSLEGELSKQFDDMGGSSSGYVPLTGMTAEDKTVCTLTVSLPYDDADTTKNLGGYPYAADPDNPKTYEISKDVTVRVVLDHATHHITLTAWLTGKAIDATSGLPEDMSDTMIAELVAREGTAPLLTYNNPEGRDAGTSPPATATNTETTNTMTWQLHWIKKGAA